MRPMKRTFNPSERKADGGFIEYLRVRGRIACYCVTCVDNTAPQAPLSTLAAQGWCGLYVSLLEFAKFAPRTFQEMNA